MVLTLQKRLPEVVSYECVFQTSKMALQPAQIAFTAANASLLCGFLEFDEPAVVCCLKVV